MNQLARMKELVKELNEAAKAYYQEDREIMSNYTYDALYDELVQLEKETNTVMANSPTIKVGYEILSELKKEPHEFPMLSLDKTKEVESLKDWLGEQVGVLSWKLDGLTIVLTYENGSLIKAVTRGNGEVGEVITNNAKTFVNIPKSIEYKGKLIVRGEAIITYPDFYKINEEIEDVDAKYKNPRNLCSGSVRQLNNEVTAKRNVHFYAFNLVALEELADLDTVEAQFQWLEQQGFEVVQYQRVTKENLEEKVGEFASQVVNNEFPSDGLVLIFNDIKYGKSLGRTAKFPRDSIAFKWADEIATTHLLKVEWSPSRTGLINPVAVFEPVELEGTTVARASLHNVSILQYLELGIGDEITVYKANMIIPQVAENLTKSNNLEIPTHCPVCNAPTVIKEENEVKSLYCVNQVCPIKKIKGFEHFVSRDAINIVGLSEATLVKFIEAGFLTELSDIYQLEQHREEIVAMEGFGEQSYQKLISAINQSKTTTMAKFIYSLGIINVGLSTAKLICSGHQTIEEVLSLTVEDLVEIEGIGEVIARSYVDFMAKEDNQKMIQNLLKYITIELPLEQNEEQSLLHKNFVITGSLNQFENRNELKAYIEELGGKVVGSVSSKTDYLINNDTMSSSSKNKKAKELNIPIISEEEFLAMVQE